MSSPTQVRSCVSTPNLKRLIPVFDTEPPVPIPRFPISKTFPGVIKALAGRLFKSGCRSRQSSLSRRKPSRSLSRSKRRSTSRSRSKSERSRSGKDKGRAKSQSERSSRSRSRHTLERGGSGDEKMLDGVSLVEKA